MNYAFLIYTSNWYIQWTNSERRWASSQESFFPQSHGTCKQRNILETIDFFDMVHGTFFFLFEHIIDIRDEPARPGPAVTLFDALFLSQFKRYSF